MSGSAYPVLSAAQWTLLGVLSGCVVASVGLATVWAIVGRRPRWYWRAAVLLVPRAGLPYRDATDLWIMLMTQVVVVAAVVGGWQAFSAWRQRRSLGPRFTLQDTALAVVLVAIVLAGMIRLELPAHPERRVMAGLGFALLTLLVTLAVQAFRWWRGQRRSAATPPVGLRGWLVPIFVLLLVVGDLGFLAHMPPRPEPLRSTTYHPNGYDVLASIPLPQTSISDSFEWLLPEVIWTDYAAATSDARRRAIGAMQAPIEPRPHESPDLDGIGAFRSLARAFCAEGLVASHQCDLPRAITAYEQCYLLGTLVGNRGLLIDRLVGNAIKWSALRGLRNLPSFPDDDQTGIESRLLEIDRTQEPLDAVLVRERHYQLRESDWLERLTLGFGGQWLSSDDLDRPRAADQCKRTAFSLELALGAYCGQRGQYPEALADLSPKFLAAVPADPFGKAPFAYRRLPNGGYLLYSVGPDGIDQGGDPDDDVPFLGRPRMPD